MSQSFVSTKVLADTLGVSRQLLAKLSGEPDCPALHVGSELRWPLPEALDYLKKRRGKAQGQPAERDPEDEVVDVLLRIVGVTTAEDLKKRVEALMLDSQTLHSMVQSIGEQSATEHLEKKRAGKPTSAKAATAKPVSNEEKAPTVPSPLPSPKPRSEWSVDDHLAEIGVHPDDLAGMAANPFA